MNDKDRIAELERRVLELERRPQFVMYPPVHAPYHWIAPAPARDVTPLPWWSPSGVLTTSCTKSLKS